MTAQEKRAPLLARREVVGEILKQRGDALLVTGLGSTSWDAAAVSDEPANFYLWGGMGGAAMVGLGLALAQPRRRVLVITGDAEQVMGLGALATIGAERPENLAVVVIDNERFGETGMQTSHTGLGLDLARIAAAAGFPMSRRVSTMSELAEAIPRFYLEPGPVFADVKVSSEPVPLVLPPRDGAALMTRFRRAVLGGGGSE